MSDDKKAKDISITPTTSLERGPSSASPASIHSTTVAVTDHVAERALCRKFDIRLMPVLATMYLFNALDKGNLGNAKTAHLEANLNFQPNQYNILLSVFYIPYVLFAPPFAMLAKRHGPNRALPLMMLGFGSFTMLAAAAQNWGSMMALRWLLGMSEAAFFPTVIYYLTTFYRRAELARRLALFYAASNIANAFSGLLAFAVFRIKDGALYPWRYLFLIEGGCSVLFAVFAWFYLPRSAAQARFLNADEKKLAFHRVQVDSSAIVDEKFVLSDSLRIFRHPSTFAFLAIEICLGVPLQSVSLFLPQIVAALGYETVKTNLYTVAPNVTGAVMLLVLAFTSDFARLRFPFIALGFAFTFIGFIIFATTELPGELTVAYFSCFMMTWGTSAPSVLLSTWYNNNVAHEGKRVALTSVGVPLANLMGVVSSNIFQSKDEPKYVPALATTAAFGATGMFIALSLGFYMRFDNARRNRRDGTNMKASDVPTERLREGPSSKEFRWFL